jgi:signal transduction histidine kinase
MRIQTRLFLGTAALVLALMATQWWLYARQLRSIEDEVTRVATKVGTRVLTAERAIFGDVLLHHGAQDLWVDVESQFESIEVCETPTTSEGEPEVRVVVVPDPLKPNVVEPAGKRVVRRREFVNQDGETGTEKIEWVVETREFDQTDTAIIREHLHEYVDQESLPEHVRKLEVAVEGGVDRHERFLVVSEGDEAVHRIPIPVSPAVEQVRETMREGATVGGLLLFVGLFASAVLSRRLTSPLRSLADGAEALGHGDLGVQVPESAGGEVGDLQRAFNLMSARLAELEAERERWQEREHLAQLGDLSRGLAHTLRNPLHTLGLAVEELASDSGDRRDLVATSRAQIRRIDRWLRSFLALGAEEVAEPEVTDLGDLIRAVALESVQQGAEVRVDGGEDELLVRVVPGAVRAALANLVENATEVSPEGENVDINIVVEQGEAVVSIADGGPGLPESVREKLFSPHVTTKIGGSGMGLFLARQLVVGMHGGGLEIIDGEEGGTVATMRLPLAQAEPEESESDLG